MEKLKLLCTVGENVKWYSCYRIQYGGSSKIKHRITIWFNNSTSGYILKSIWSRVSQRYLSPYVHTRVHRRWRLPTCPLTTERIRKMWHIHTVEYCLAFNRKNILTRSATWMVEDMVLSEISQSQKDKYCLIPLIWGT